MPTTFADPYASFLGSNPSLQNLLNPFSRNTNPSGNQGWRPPGGWVTAPPGSTPYTPRDQSGRPGTIGANTMNGGSPNIRPFDDVSVAQQGNNGTLNGYPLFAPQGAPTSPLSTGGGGSPVQGAPGAPGSQGINLDEQLLALGGALGRDTGMEQGAADRQHAANQAQIDALGNFVGGMGSAITGAANQGADQLEGAAAGAQKQGDQQYADFKKWQGGVMDATNKDVNSVFGSVDQAMAKLGMSDADIQAGYAYADQAIGTMKDALVQYKDRTAQDASVMAGAIKNQAATQMAQLMGPRPDGTMPSPNEIAQGKYQIQSNNQQAVESAITPLYSRFNENQVAIRQSIAGLQGNAAALHMQGAGLHQQSAALGLQGAQTKLSAASLRAQTGTELGAQQNQAAGLRQQMTSLAAGLREAAVGMRSSAVLQSTQLELQGRTAIAQLVRENPETVVGVFNGLMAMFSLQNSVQANQRAQQGIVGGGPQGRGASFSGGGRSGQRFGFNMNGYGLGSMPGVGSGTAGWGNGTGYNPSGPQGSSQSDMDAAMAGMGG